MTMRILALLASVIFATAAQSQTLSGGSASGAVFGSASGGGSGGFAADANGVEDRYAELVSLTHVLCSEPMNYAPGVEGTVTHNEDFASSDNASECWGPGGNWQIFDSSSSDHTMVSVADWGSASYALQPGTGFIWLLGYKPSAVPSGNIAMCYRYYIQVDASGYGNTGGNLSAARGDCSAGTTWRNKLMASAFEHDDGVNPPYLVQHQLEESPYSGEICDASGVNRGPINVGPDNGPCEQNVNLTPTVDLSDCDDGPCRIEYCLEGDLSTATNIIERTRIIDENGVEHTATLAACSYNGTTTANTAWGGDKFHSGPGDDRIGYFMNAIFTDANSAEWIGCAEEIEGIGCND